MSRASNAPLAAVIAMTAAGLLAGCGEEPAARPAGEPAVARSAPVTELPPPPDLPSDMNEAAAVLIDRMQQAYGAAPAFEDRVTQRYTNENMIDPPSQTMTVRCGPDNSARLLMAWVEWTAADGYVYLTDKRHPSRYVVTPMIDNLYTTIATTFGTAGGVPPQIALRTGVEGPELLRRLTLNVLKDEPTISACRRETNEDGEVVDLLTLTTVEGWVTLRVHPSAHFITSAVAQLDLGAGGGPSMFLDLEFDFQPRVLDADEVSITFDPGDRVPVATIEELQQP